MSGMQNFVREREQVGNAKNAHKAQPVVNAKRQAIGANAKISPKNTTVGRRSPHRSEIPSRGLSISQNIPALHRQTRQQPGSKPDPYDTDADSLDTTVNHSVRSEVELQENHQQRHQQAQDIDLAPGSETDEEESEVGDEHGSVEYQFTREDIRLITENELQQCSREQQLAFLQQVRRPGAFQTVDGDSYPPTTNGDPTEWDGGEEPFPEHHDVHAGKPAFPQGTLLNDKSAHPFAPLSVQKEQVTNISTNNHSRPNTFSIFRQSASLRDQQRLTGQISQRGQVPIKNVPALSASQLPTYSQANRESVTDLPARSNINQETYEKSLNPSNYAQIPPAQTDGSGAIPKHSTSHVKVEAVAQQQPVQRGSIDSEVFDYDLERLYAMSYNQLRKEDFDTNPHVDPQILTDDVLQKPLAERLEFVQKNFDAGRQAEFFRTLPTAEWEDAGDWFLDQFQSVIQRSKEARQRKRKLAQEFENEVEKRYEHISKKQQQVEEAMTKMKMQGEGLVSKSPRLSKSPRSKKGS